MTLPDWLFDGIAMKGGVLTIHEDYFLLTGGIERWMYRVARKHAGRQEMGWRFTMRQLYEKSGSSARFSRLAEAARRQASAGVSAAAEAGPGVFEGEAGAAPHAVSERESVSRSGESGRARGIRARVPLPGVEAARFVWR